MTEEQKVAYIIAQSVCAFIETQAMIAENQNREHRGESLAYTEDAFNALLEKYPIGHNAVMKIIND